MKKITYLLILITILSFFSVLNWKITEHYLTQQGLAFKEKQEQFTEANKEIGKLKNEAEFTQNYIDDRCVCLIYSGGSSTTEGLSRQDICDYPLKEGEYSLKYGYSLITK